MVVGVTSPHHTPLHTRCSCCSMWSSVDAVQRSCRPSLMLDRADVDRVTGCFLWSPGVHCQSCTVCTSKSRFVQSSSFGGKSIFVDILPLYLDPASKERIYSMISCGNNRHRSFCADVCTALVKVPPHTTAIRAYFSLRDSMGLQFIDEKGLSDTEHAWEALLSFKVP